MNSNLLTLFNECIRNNEAFFNKYRTASGDILLVSKYQYLSYFTITHCDRNGNTIYNVHDFLYPFDCWNLINELVS